MKLLVKTSPTHLLKKADCVCPAKLAYFGVDPVGIRGWVPLGHPVDPEDSPYESSVE